MTDAQKVLSALDYVYPTPLSDYGIYHVSRGLGAKMTPSSARTRRAELVRRGYIRQAIGHEISSTGRKAARWELTPLPFNW